MFISYTASIFLDSTSWPVSGYVWSSPGMMFSTFLSSIFFIPHVELLVLGGQSLPKILPSPNTPLLPFVAIGEHVGGG